MAIFKGSGAALVTPFKGDERKSVNYDVFERLINFQIENGTDALIICGTTGEASTLSDDEQIAAISFAVSTAKKRVPVIAGAGSNDTAHGINLCKRARDAGVDALLLVTPYYNKTQQHGLIGHFGKMAAAVDLPIILYNVPSRTGLNIEAATTAELYKIDNIVGIKEASGKIDQVAKIASLCDIDIYAGNDDEILPVLSLGGKGVISVLADVAPKAAHDMTALYFAGKAAEATALQVKHIELINALFCEVNPVPVKAAMNLMGFNVGECRSPLAPMLPKNEETLKQALKKVNLL